jgi:protein O-GlcNAc transferase
MTPRTYAPTHAIPRALQHYERGDFDRAIGLLKSFLLRQPANVDALNLLGVVHAERGDKAAALGFFEKAVRIDPASIEVLSNLAKAQNETGRFAAALETYDNLIARGAANHLVVMDKGLALMHLGRLGEAMAHFDKAIELEPDYPPAWHNRAHLLADLNRYEEALENTGRALVLRPDYAEALAIRGYSLSGLKRHEDACVALERSLELKEDIPYLFGYLLHARMLICNWGARKHEFAEWIQRAASVELPSLPFALLPTPLSPAQIKQSTQVFLAHRFPYSPAPWSAPRYAHARIRLGYFSSDFNDVHPVGLVMPRLIELHDRNRFEVFGFSLSEDTRTRISPRLEKSFDRLIEVGHLAGTQALDFIRNQEIDIAIDLNGHTQGGRPELFLERVAPIQVNYLGYPGTLGAGLADYIVADARVIPEADRPHFAESVAYLPHSYFPAPAEFSSVDAAPSTLQALRAAAGLPEQGFVFCCFNNSFKIEPDVFAVWMQLLSRVAGSVLWLSAHGAGAVKNLRREAAKRGVAAERLVFAPRLPERADHLRRIGLADLFLDTFYYNAHTTACDALGAGVPVLTCYGETFAGRAAASLLHAVGLPELVAHSHVDYEEKAGQLATQPDLLSALRAKLAKNRAACPLFDTPLLVRHLESAYGKMFERHSVGLAPEHIFVTD